MIIVCKTLVLLEGKEIARIVSKALEPPKFETFYAWTPAEAQSFLKSNTVDLFVVSTSFRNENKVRNISGEVPTLYIEPDYVGEGNSDLNQIEEAAKIKTSAERLLRKNYINWVVDALEYENS